jgi:exonuclease III
LLSWRNCATIGSTAPRIALPTSLGDYAAFDLTNVYRTLHGYERQEFRWYHPASNNCFRLDHVPASRSLRARGCRSLDQFRTVEREKYPGLGVTKLSDHAAMEVDFEPLPQPLPDPERGAE